MRLELAPRNVRICSAHGAAQTALLARGASMCRTGSAKFSRPGPCATVAGPGEYPRKARVKVRPTMEQPSQPRAACRVPRAACRVPRAACRVPRAACRVPRAVDPCKNYYGFYKFCKIDITTSLTIQNNTHQNNLNSNRILNPKYKQRRICSTTNKHHRINERRKISTLEFKISTYFNFGGRLF